MIHFSQERWNTIQETYRKWWACEIERPIIQLRVNGYDTDMPEPDVEAPSQGNCHRFEIDPEAIVKRWEYDLSTKRFYGDAFPNINFAFLGPGVLAAFLGARLDNSSGRVWFHPAENCELADLKMQYDRDNKWLVRLKELYAAAVEYFQGMVQVDMTDIGGNLDVLSVFRPGEDLLMDLLMDPESVKEKTWEVYEHWWRCFEDLQEVLRPGNLNPGYSAWLTLYSEVPYYVLQSDFSYMISPEQFDMFVKPELKASAERLGNAFYHLDGPGELNHLDSLLEIEAIKGIQWVPGDGNAALDQWPEVMKKISDAGKLTWIWGNFEQLERIFEQTGGAKNHCVTMSVDKEQESEALEFLERWGVPREG